MAGKAAKDALLEKLLAAKVRPVDLAKALGVKKSQASMMLSGQRGISTWHLDAVAGLLNVSVAQLFTASDLPDHAIDPSSDPPRGSDVTKVAAAHARIQQQHQALLAATEAVAIQLADALAAQGVTIQLPHHDAGITADQPISRKRSRKTG